MTEVEHKNVRLDLTSLVSLFFIVGFCAGLVFIPLSLAEFYEQDLLWSIAAAIFTPLVNGVAAVVVLFCGFPFYALVARKRSGYTVRLIQMNRGSDQQDGQGE